MNFECTQTTACTGCLEHSLKKYYHDELGLPDWERNAAARLITERYGYDELVKKLGITGGKKVLSVGSGWGGFTIAASKAGADSIGIEPDTERLEVSISEAYKSAYKSGNQNCTLIRGKGENIRFEDSTFDVIDCTSVLEHVEDPEKVINEMVRVLKPGGICHISAPNYWYPAEAHYKIYWIPMMPKQLAVIYLKLIGRNPEFIKHINYITPGMLRRILGGINEAVVIDVGNKPVQDAKTATTISSALKRYLWNFWATILELFHEEKTNELLISKKVAINVQD